MKVENICDKCQFNSNLLFPVYLYGEPKLWCYQCFRKEIEK